MCSAHRIIQGKRHSLLNTHDLGLKFFTAHKSQGRNFISQVSIIDGAVKLYVMKGTDTFFGRIHYPLQNETRSAFQLEVHHRNRLDSIITVVPLFPICKTIIFLNISQWLKKKPRKAVTYITSSFIANQRR